MYYRHADGLWKILFLSIYLAHFNAAAQPKKSHIVPGYTNTPMLPNSPWHVHDPNRPLPKMVTPKSFVHAPAPSDAFVLFDGKSMDVFVTNKDRAPVGWTIGNGEVTFAPHASIGKGDSIQTVEKFGDMQLHIEWKIPETGLTSKKKAYIGGLFFMSEYKLQIYNSFSEVVYPDGQAAAIYGQTPPLVNASLPAGEWQSFDVIFEAPRFDKNEKLLKKAFLTVFHNGVLVQNRTPIIGPARYKTTAPYKAHAAAAPLIIQDHGYVLSFRNIWARKLNLSM